MPLRLLFFLTLFIPLSSIAQLEKGDIGIFGDVDFFYKYQGDSGPFITTPQVNFRTPTIDYYFKNKHAIGGSFAYNSFKILENNEFVRYQQFLFRPHVKYGLNVKKFNFFLSASGQYFKQSVGESSAVIEDLSMRVGTGGQWFLSRNISLEMWLQYVLVSNNSPNLNPDFTYTFGLKFYNKSYEKIHLNRELYDYYLDEYNIRLGFNSRGFQTINIIAGLDAPLFSRFDFSYQNFFRDYFVFYTDYRWQNDFEQNVDAIRLPGYRLKFGFETYFPITNQFYFNIKSGLVSTNVDAFFTTLAENSFGADLGGSFIYFFPKRAVLKTGFDWQATASGRFEATYQSLMPYVGLEYFLNETVSIEPQLRHITFRAEEEIRTQQIFDVVKTSSSSFVFELKFRTLIYRSSGIFQKEKL
jgi:hypothetical protein